MRLHPLTYAILVALDDWRMAAWKARALASLRETGHA